MREVILEIAKKAMKDVIECGEENTYPAQCLQSLIDELEAGKELHELGEDAGKASIVCMILGGV